jgi:hypothetical protein
MLCEEAQTMIYHIFVLMMPFVLMMVYAPKSNLEVHVIGTSVQVTDWTYTPRLHVSETCRKEIMRPLPGGSFDGVEALELWPFGRYGNHLIVFTLALIWCELLEIPNIVLTSFVLTNRSFVTTRGLKIFQLGEKSFAKMVVRNAWPWHGHPHCPSDLLLQTTATVKDELLSHFPRPNITNRTLVMHFRGSEIFAERKLRARCFYGQPCCQFYVDVMNRDLGHDNVVLVSQDTLNPCVKICLDHGATLHPSKFMKFSDRMGVLLWSERIALSRSTVMRAVMYLSPVRKTWYHFGGLNIKDPGCGAVWYFLQPLGAHWHCIPSQEYQVDMILNWHPSKVSKMVNGTCEWTYIPYINSIDWIDVRILMEPGYRNDRNRCGC